MSIKQPGWLFMLIVTLAVAIPSTAATQIEADREIERLIQYVEASGATFTRNGSEYNAEEAAAHLRLKWRNGKKYAATAEEFIDNLATKSSFSGKPYWITEPGKAKVPSGEWLKQALAAIRQRSAASAEDPPADISTTRLNPARELTP